MSTDQIKEYAIIFKGGYQHYTSKVQYIAIYTWLGIVLSVQHLSELNNSPIEMAFESIGCDYRYFARDTTTCTIICFQAPVQNILDSEFTIFISDRKTCYCLIIMLYNAAVQWK